MEQIRPGQIPVLMAALAFGPQPERRAVPASFRTDGFAWAAPSGGSQDRRSDSPARLPTPELPTVTYGSTKNLITHPQPVARQETRDRFR